MIDLLALAPGTNLALSLVAAVAIWLAGTALTHKADRIARRTGLGEAFAGALLLGVATSLPEIATTTAAAAGGNARLAGSNLIGGVAMQIAVLAVLDATVVRGRALTAAAAEPGLLMQSAFLILLLGVLTAAVIAGERLMLAKVGAWSILLGALYVVILAVLYRYERRPRWFTNEPIERPTADPVNVAESHRTTPVLWLQFAVSGAVVLGAGYLIARAGAALAIQTGLGESIIGATLVAIATSLPEVSTTFAAVRLGAFGMAFGNILGTNLLELGLFLPADVFYRGGAMFDALDRSAVFLAAIAVVMTSIYLWGLLERRDRLVLRMGVDSLAVAAVYGGGLAIFWLLRSP